MIEGSRGRGPRSRGSISTNEDSRRPGDSIGTAGPGTISWMRRSLDFPDASFDKALSLCVVEHLEDDELVMRNVARALKPGGLFVFSADSLSDAGDHARRKGAASAEVCGEYVLHGRDRHGQARAGRIRDHRDAIHPLDSPGTSPSSGSPGSSTGSPGCSGSSGSRATGRSGRPERSPRSCRETATDPPRAA